MVPPTARVGCVVGRACLETAGCRGAAAEADPFKYPNRSRASSKDRRRPVRPRATAAIFVAVASLVAAIFVVAVFGTFWSCGRSALF